MRNLFIIKRITEDKELSDDAFVVWCALRSIMTKDTTEYYVSYNRLFCELYGKRKSTKHIMQCIKNGLNELLEKKFIQVTFAYDRDSFMLDLSKLYYEHGSEFYSDLTTEEMQKIMNIECKNASNKKMLRYFTCMIGTFNRSSDIEAKFRGKIGGMSLDSFVDKIDISKVTASTYNKILEENKLLFVIRHHDFYQMMKDRKSTVREIPNTYSRWCDQQLAIEFAETCNGYTYLQQIKNKQSSEANMHRSLATKYKWLLKGKSYDKPTLEQMYVWATEKNEVAMKYYNAEKEKGYKPMMPEMINLDPITMALTIAN